MIRREWAAVAALTAILFAGAASARDLEEILKDKDVITDVEADEAKAAKEKAEAQPKGAAPTQLPEWLAKVTPFGDVRVRNESFFRDGDPDRVRQRFRLRFGLNVKPTSETLLGFRLATGSSGDPISNNQTFTDTFTFKSVNVSNAYLKLQPAATLGWAKPYLTLMGGKFDLPTWHPTAVHYDRDLTPEGFFEAIQPVQSTEGLVRLVSLNLGQWIFNESSKRGDSAIFAFQGQTTVAPTSDVVIQLAAGDFKYQKASTIAAARNKNPDLSITNFVELSDGTRDGGRKVDPSTAGPGKDGKDAAGKPITITRFLSDFNVVDVGADATVKTWSARWPIRPFAEYVVNTDAEGSDDTGYEFGLSIGPAKEPNDLQFSYWYERLETDAVMSAFTESDFGHDGGTNTKAHVLQLSYMLPMKGLQLLSTSYFDEPVRDVPGRNGNRDVRWQVDLIGKF
jgi:hypothetical protein